MSRSVWERFLAHFPETHPSPEMTGPTVYLRRLRLDDAARILELLREPEVSRFFLWEPPHDLIEAEHYVQGFLQEADQQRAYHFAVVGSASNELLGVANLYHIDPRAGEAEIGIWLGRDYWGQGVQQEVNGLLLQFGFEALQLQRIIFQVAAGNARAQAAFRKLGATDRGRAMLFSQRQDRRVAHRVYGLEVAQWREASDQPSAISFQRKRRTP